MSQMDLMSADDLAATLGVTRDAIRAARGRGNLPPSFKMLGRRYWRLCDVESFIAEQLEADAAHLAGRRSINASRQRERSIRRKATQSDKRR